MRLKYILISALLATLVAGLCGLAAAETTGYPVNITDDYGTTVTITKAPERIVSLSPANTEILFDLGLGGKIVGDTEYCNYPAEAVNITHVSGFNTISYEKISAVNPDIIFAEDIVGEEAVKKLRSLGYNLIELKNNNLSAIRHSIEIMGRATGTSANATTLIGNIDKQVSSISARTAGLKESDKPTVLMVVGLYGDDTIYPFGSDTYGDELIRMAGGRNAAANISQYSVMSHEAIIAADPDVIIVPVDAISRPYYQAFMNGSTAWATGLSAYKNHKIYEVDADIMNRPSPRLATAGMMIVDILHPEAVTNATATPAGTATPTPGFEAVFALAGLLGVVCLFAGRKH